MTTFNKQELQAIAHLSALTLNENETELFAQQIQSILQYIDQLKAVPLTSAAQPVRNINVMREDEIIKTDPAPIMAQAPAIDEHFFVVPKILDEK